MYELGSIGLNKTCQSTHGLAFFIKPNIVSLVPRLIAISPEFYKPNPAREHGLSPDQQMT